MAQTKWSSTHAGFITRLIIVARIDRVKLYRHRFLSKHTDFIKNNYIIIILLCHINHLFLGFVQFFIIKEKILINYLSLS